MGVNTTSLAPFSLLILIRLSSRRIFELTLSVDIGMPYFLEMVLSAEVRLLYELSFNSLRSIN
ncbi:MAG: hypothetical protein QXH57_00420 [Sulfolobales archaeon]